MLYVCVCVCACVCACVRACVRVCVHECVSGSQVTEVSKRDLLCPRAFVYVASSGMGRDRERELLER